MNKQEKIQELIDSSLQLMRLMMRVSASEVGDRKATTLQCHALRFIADQKQVTVGCLADELSMSSSAVAQMSDRLVKAGWAERLHDKEDRRIVKLSLTNEGNKVLKIMAKKHREKMGKLFSLISENDLSELIRIQKKLIIKMEEA